MEQRQSDWPDRCVSCGAPIPEGRMICICCESSIEHALDMPQVREEKESADSNG